MATMTYEECIPGLLTYKKELQTWAETLARSEGFIMAIARKAPRMLELLVHLGMLPPSVLDRVFSERALPLLRQIDRDLFVVDNAMIYGSTFDRVMGLAHSKLEQLAPQRNVTGVPFAVSEMVPEEYRRHVKKYFCYLSEEEVASFVYSVASAFRLLGKPYDLEHPIYYLHGDFSETCFLEELLEKMALALDGELIPTTSKMVTGQGLIPAESWTILLRQPSRYTPLVQPDFGKLRIYIGEDKSRLAVATMCPISMATEDFDNIISSLPSELKFLWDCVLAGDDKNQKDVNKQCSLVMWANYLIEVVAAKKMLSVILDEKSFEDGGIILNGPTRYDLQLLIGPSNSIKCSEIIQDFLNSDTPYNNVTQEKRERITYACPLGKMPEEGVVQYERLLTQLLANAHDVSDVMNSIFFAQHQELERPFRSCCGADYDRLNFGMSLSGLSQKVREKVPDAGDREIHYCLDKMIDQGSIVPRYIKCDNDGQALWCRVFRVGEGTTFRRAHAVRLLFNSLATATKLKELPALMFEKFCVLVFDTSLAFEERITGLAELSVKTLFHTYGARSHLAVCGHSNFLVDWACDRNFLSRKGNDGEGDWRTKYHLPNLKNPVYSEAAIPFSKREQEAVEDIADFVALINDHASITKPLVTITSTASKKCLYKAVEAELYLWLDDEKASVYRVLEQFMILRLMLPRQNMENATASDKKKVFEPMNDLLVQNSRFTRQVEDKLKYFRDRENTFREITEIVNRESPQKTERRLWEAMRRSLENKAKTEDKAPGLETLLSALRIAHSTTSLMRNLLSMAGWEDPKGREKPIPEAVDELCCLIGNKKRINREVESYLQALDGNSLSITEKLYDAINPAPVSFVEAFDRISPVIHEIAERCSIILQTCENIENDDKLLGEAVNVPCFVFMWDIKNSRLVKDKKALKTAIKKTYDRIKAQLNGEYSFFEVSGTDDGGGIVFTDFSQVLAAFEILLDGLGEYPFRSGCDANLQGELDYYPEEHTVGGGAFAYAKAFAYFFDEMKGTLPNGRTRWTGERIKDEPDKNYLVVGEHARKYAEEANKWPPLDFNLKQYKGEYLPRGQNPMPVGVSILTRNNEFQAH